jgi:uncharacterized BrkB/YihY/UPF0761 family membrane protein
MEQRSQELHLVPGAVATSVELVVLMLVSSRVMQFWIDLYAKDYGGIGVFLAIYFWIAFSSAVIVIAASFSPVLAEWRRREASLRAAQRRRRLDV